MVTTQVMFYFSDAYFSPTQVDRSSIAAKLTHVLNPTTFYDLIISNFNSSYDTNPGEERDYSKSYLFGNAYYTDEAPFGYSQTADGNVLSPTSMRLGSIYSQGRDSSKVSLYNVKFDLQSQVNKYHNLKSRIFI